MALATTTSHTLDLGLLARMSAAKNLIGALVADLDPDTLLGADAASLYAEISGAERLLVAAKTLLAPRIAASGHWESEGHRSPASLLADLEGVSAGQARRTLATGQRLSELPSVERALRQGRLSGAKAAEITDAATLDPRAETTLLAGSEDESLQATKERCQRFKATSSRHDPLASAQRIHATRAFHHWTGADGAFCFRGQDTPERGVALLARLVPVANRLRRARRAAATEATDSPTDPPTDAPIGPPTEPETALRADALFYLVTGGATHTTGTTNTTGTTPTTHTTPTTPTTPSVEPGLASADDLVDHPAPVTVIVRVDRDALVRGHAEPGELCELDGQGPISVPLARALATDSFLSVLFTEAGDIRAVSHLGRTINQKLRTALCFRDRVCVVPGCAMPYGLEIDHVKELEFGGPTELANLALLCTHHHRLKTYEGWVLRRNGPTDEDPQWSFTPQPPFGQEPDLGFDTAQARRNRDRDRPPEATPRK